jgi:hypothetical protein
VTATCRDGLVSVTAVPSVGWEVHDRTAGRVTTARVSFEPSHQGHGRHVVVVARCASNRPVFGVTQRFGGESGEGDDGGGTHD